MHIILISKKQIHFATMGKCISDFREFMKPTNLPYDEIVEQYVDLVNEEFFYLENKYLPIDITIEWVDGMIDFLPFFDKNGNYINSQYWPALTQAETIRILNNYPRVLKSIQLKKTIDFSLIHLEILDNIDREKRKQERNKLIYEMISKLKISWWRKCRLEINIASR
jgi:hypothetical protein